MDHFLDIHTSPRTPRPMFKQQNREDFWRKRQEEIEAIENFCERAIPITRLKKVISAEKGTMLMTSDTPSFMTKACEIFVQELALRAWRCADSHHRCMLLHEYWKEPNSASHPKPTKKHHRPTDQQSTSRHPFLHEYHLPQFGSQFAEYASPIPISPLPPTNVHPIPLPFPCLPQQAPPLMAATVTPIPIMNGTISPTVNYMARDLGFSGGINTRNTNLNAPGDVVVCNNIVDSSVVTPRQVYAGAMPTIHNGCYYMNTTNAFYATYGVGGTATSSNGHTTTSIIEINHSLPEATKTRNSIHGSGSAINNSIIDLGDSIGVNDSQRYLYHEETITGQCLMHENLDVEVVATTGVGGNEGDMDIVNGLLMDKFWNDVLRNEDPPVDDLPQLSCNILINDLKGFNNHEWYLFEDIISGNTTSY
ncbi:hypothetical protein ACP70R_023899 [Stipagrostis hirtigluma subsp. patula]